MKTPGQIACDAFHKHEQRGSKSSWDVSAEAVIAEHERRKAEQVKPEWKLPDPPEGEQWHCTDWTRDMLSEGWRPLLVGENKHVGTQIIQQEAGGQWATYSEECEPNASDKYYFMRTSRPLPVKPDPYAAEKAAFAQGKTIQSYSTMGRKWIDLPIPSWCAPPNTYRVKPDPVLVPLGPDDVKCGQRIKHKNYDVSIESMICGVFGDGVARVQWSTGGVSMEIVKWGELKREWSIDRNDGKGWVACSKEVQP